MRIALAVILTLHGIAHLPGFVVPWKLAVLQGMPYKTAILDGRFNIGDAGARTIGALWLVIAVAFWIAASGLLMDQPWSLPTGVVAAAASFTLCIIAWPNASLGLPMNVAIAGALLLAPRFGWL